MSKKEMSPAEKAAKMKAVNDMRDMASSMMKDGLGKHMEGMKKVSVAAPTENGLSMGLDKAKEMLGSDSKLSDLGEESEHDKPAEHEEEEGPQDESKEEHAPEMHDEEESEEHESPKEEESELEEMHFDNADEIKEMMSRSAR